MFDVSIFKRCQEYFVRKANKDLKASTHLVVKEAEGSKYQAAKKWNIPAISKRYYEWCILKLVIHVDTNNEHITDDCFCTFTCLYCVVLMFALLLIKGGYSNVLKLGNGPQKRIT